VRSNEIQHAIEHSSVTPSKQASSEHHACSAAKILQKGVNHFLCD
jgi:hypothetical protein